MARHNAKHNRRRNSSPDFRSQKISADTERFYRIIPQVLRKTRDGVLKGKNLGLRACRRRNPAAYRAALEQLLREGKVLRGPGGYCLPDASGCFQATTLRIVRSFGFIEDENGTAHFVPGKFLKGSMPGDTVLARSIPSRTGEPEAEVVSVLEEAPRSQLAGVILEEDGQLLLLPDTMGHMPLQINRRESVPFAAGDKVLAVLVERGSRHSEHTVKILLNFGTCARAEHCIAARIAEQDIPVDFPEEVLSEAACLTETVPDGRRDLRGECIFTIDGTHSKDLDDAVSVKKIPGGWELGVHIADVSHFVRPGSALDKEAFLRGTSLYYGNSVIPMLPPALSNGICSLNAGADRLAVSAFMKISPEGDLLEYTFEKSVIRSVLRGVYDECNAVLDGTASPQLREKYAPVTESLHLLEELTGILDRRRYMRGAPSLESTEALPILDETGLCTGLVPVQRGRSEEIIEACMLAANEAAARLAREQKLPLVYRVHEDPSPEKLCLLREMLEKFGVELPESISPGDIQRILDNARKEDYFPVVNSLILRSMAKARYSEKPLGHFGLALRDYAHFTSPIRRYPDLAVHRILSGYLSGESPELLQRRYRRFTENAARQSSDTELRAVTLERTADACYAAEYMQAHIGEVFSGLISGITEHGVYVTLDNMAEVMIHMEDLPEDSYEMEEGWYIRSSRLDLTIGGRLDTVCLKADVNTGKILAGLPQRTP